MLEMPKTTLGREYYITMETQTCEECKNQCNSEITCVGLDCKTWSAAVRCWFHTAAQYHPTASEDMTSWKKECRGKGCSDGSREGGQGVRTPPP